MTSLCLVTPTRKRWSWLHEQILATAPQLQDGDAWVIVADNDQPDQETMELAGATLGDKLTVVELTYTRHSEINCLTRAYNAGVAMAPAGHAIVDVDDHDTLRPGCLDSLRAALDAGAMYVFGDAHRRALTYPSPGMAILEPWPDLTHRYTPGAFGRGEIEALGVRAYSSLARYMVGPWGEGDWPMMDMAWALELELQLECDHEHGEGIGPEGSIVHLPQKLCTITIDADSLMATYRDAPQAV